MRIIAKQHKSYIETFISSILRTRPPMAGIKQTNIRAGNRATIKPAMVRNSGRRDGARARDPGVYYFLFYKPVYCSQNIAANCRRYKSDAKLL